MTPKIQYVYVTLSDLGYFLTLEDGYVIGHESSYRQILGEARRACAERTKEDEVWKIGVEPALAEQLEILDVA